MTRKTQDTGRQTPEDKKSLVFPASLFCLVGPTAVGKSAVALELSERINGEIVSCDAMQVYREVCIATDRPSDADRARIPHHLVGILSVEDDFSAAQYRILAEEAIRDIVSRGKRPVLCGGSGMYLMALLDGLFEDGGKDEGVRARLEAEAREKGAPFLHARLEDADPAAAARIAPNDLRRIIRALEVFETTGRPISQRQKEREGLRASYDVRGFLLERPREDLYRRAEARVEDMFARGLVEEVRALFGKKLSASAGRIIGVPELRAFCEGSVTMEEAKALMKQNTRRYIKRQLTWFRRDRTLSRIMIDGGEASAETSERILKEAGII
ncbi:MAG: tRNA (adenosine(37)-N6)-dimethylallyltransferase MiaA [Elusimicrobia bacterium]|nr:tRNA (adenosine(37)-N6)-dimethylallyltransferase MiaA [Elusimicrobiota bacterium]